MRTVSFKSVYDGVVRRLGLDPVGDTITQDTARSITEHINERAQTAWQMWDWPEFTLTEERAYRAPWYSAADYSSDNEVYYVADQKYYKVKHGSNPPVSTVPTDTTYWEVLDPVTPYIARDQAGRLPIDKVIGVYKSDPSLNGCAPHDICLKFRPSESGTWVCYGPSTTVWVCYAMPAPEYTVVPWIEGKYYVPGSRVFWAGLDYPRPIDYPGFGEVYRCLALTNTQLPSDASFWSREPVPSVFASYIKLGAVADCLKETFTQGEDQVRLARAAALDADAETAIRAEIDQLLAQGQKHYYIKPYWDNGWCLSEPWPGSVAVPLLPVFISTGQPGEIPEGLLPARITSFGDTRITTYGDVRITR